jgi:hypothetical protein
MQTTNPIEDNGHVYPLYSASLAISSLYKNNQFEAYTSLRLVPTRLDEQGNGITLEEKDKSIAIGTVTNISGPEQEAMQEIYQAVQKYIIAKGL